MDNTFALSRKLIIFAIVLPTAAILGYLLATPGDFDSIALIAMGIFALAIPLLMKWHHFLLVLTWNAAITIFFLPGQPEIWVPIAGLSIIFTIGNRIMSRERAALYVPSVVWPLLFLAAVVLVTMKLNGGIGLRSLGASTYGGKRFFYILIAIMGYFAMTGQRIPLNRATLYVTIFFLSAVTAIISNLAFFGGPSFYFLYYIFPATMAYAQANAEFSVVGSNFMRLTGISFAAPALYYVLLLRYGIHGILSPSKLWRLVLFSLLVFVSLLGGFRSSLLMLGVLLAFLFYFEKLFRTRLLLVVLLAAVLGGATLIPLARHLPMSVQRSLSFLPIEVNPKAQYDAQISTEWRLRMWKILLPQVPKYFWLGKGYGIDATDYYLLQETTLRHSSFETELTIASGSWHNGPLTLIIPLSVFGFIGFLWFAIASIRILHRNYAHGPPELKQINTFLLAYFCMRFVYFLFFYGHFPEDLAVFTGVIGLSISLNGVIEKPQPGEELATAETISVPTPSSQLAPQQG